MTDSALDTSNVQPPTPSTEVKTVTAQQLPLSCPLPEDEVWNMHPRVYLPIEDDPNGEAVCPYCGAHYRLQR
ncbi:MAG: zinc-finger domain-containing protein [Thiohalocapsa sp.]|jgi:uncharacterized Zn-finger protein|nr:zinc-finger domain-containing protein [Thiohalocapsa sp.]